MKILIFLTIIIIFTSCSRSKDETKYVVVDSSPIAETKPDATHVGSAEVQTKEAYANARFKNVNVRKQEKDIYRITGEGQIFEASFNWVVEDGHHELISGYATTDNGAPAWGKFDFSVRVPSRKVNAVLHLIIFEASAEDGRRQHELAILLK